MVQRSEGLFSTVLDECCVVCFWAVVSLTALTFQMTVAPDASEQEVAYADKWRYVIQLRCVCVVMLRSVRGE